MRRFSLHFSLGLFLLLCSSQVLAQGIEPRIELLLRQESTRIGSWSMVKGGWPEALRLRPDSLEMLTPLAFYRALLSKEPGTYILKDRGRAVPRVEVGRNGTMLWRDGVSKEVPDSLLASTLVHQFLAAHWLSIEEQPRFFWGTAVVGALDSGVTLVARNRRSLKIISRVGDRFQLEVQEGRESGTYVTSWSEMKAALDRPLLYAILLSDQNLRVSPEVASFEQGEVRIMRVGRDRILPWKVQGETFWVQEGGRWRALGARADTLVITAVVRLLEQYMRPSLNGKRLSNNAYQEFLRSGEGRIAFTQVGVELEVHGGGKTTVHLPSGLAFPGPQY